MKKNLLIALPLMSFAFLTVAFAADETTAVPATTSTETSSSSTAPTAPTAPVEAPAAPEAVAVATTTLAAPVAAEATEAAAKENLEFVSGEVGAIDAATKSVTVKLYGETDDNVTDKTLTVTTDASTDITDGEKDRELGSLAAGTEVDVEYDPATKKATYVFVY